LAQFRTPMQNGVLKFGNPVFLTTIVFLKKIFYVCFFFLKV